MLNPKTMRFWISTKLRCWVMTSLFYITSFVSSIHSHLLVQEPEGEPSSSEEQPGQGSSYFFSNTFYPALPEHSSKNEEGKPRPPKISSLKKPLPRKSGRVVTKKTYKETSDEDEFQPGLSQGFKYVPGSQFQGDLEDQWRFFCSTQKKIQQIK